MKLTIIGGAGVRTPLFIRGLANLAPTLGLTNVTLMDRQEEKLRLIGALCRHLLHQAGDPVTLDLTTDPRVALSGADFVVTTVRVGDESARVLDERIALDLGVLGQETTGPGGFAMALRSIPVILQYADLMAEICPRAWLLNFTNPAGLVAQAIADARPTMRVAGICDTPPTMLRAVAQALGHPADELEFTFYGLNHLSWLASARYRGEDLLPGLLADDRALRALPDEPFEPALTRMIGMIPNEYLYYYYYRERAVANILAARESRGEQVARLSAKLLTDLRSADPERRPDEGMAVYRAYLGTRRGSYMAAETGGHMDRGADEVALAEGNQGYAGVAMAVMSAVQSGSAHKLILNVPNHGAIAGLEDADVIEAMCEVDETGAHSLAVGDIPEHALLLMRQVKRYERLTVAASAGKSRNLAVEALLAHPLVGSYSLATALVERYLTAHAPYVGAWT
ncbi:MAG TPA: glycoside hydrolase [Chloroflexota bacterium]